jgi:hypothetical protein
MEKLASALNAAVDEVHWKARNTASTPMSFAE